MYEKAPSKMFNVRLREVTIEKIRRLARADRRSMSNWLDVWVTRLPEPEPEQSGGEGKP